MTFHDQEIVENMPIVCYCLVKIFIICKLFLHCCYRTIDACAEYRAKIVKIRTKECRCIGALISAHVVKYLGHNVIHKFLLGLLLNLSDL